MKTRIAQLSLVVALLLVACSVTGCGGDTSSPENAVTAYHEALKAKDKERMKSVLSKDDLANMKEDKEIKSDEDTSGDYKLGASSISGDSATVEVTYTKEGKDGMKMTYHCVKEDGDWKVSMKKTMEEMVKKMFGGALGGALSGDNTTE